MAPELVGQRYDYRVDMPLRREGHRVGQWRGPRMRGGMLLGDH